MRSEIVRSQVSLDFDDAAHALQPRRSVHEAFTEQLLCDRDRVAIVKVAFEFKNLRGSFATGRSERARGRRVSRF